ncbi:MAG: hypothetical protein V4710_12885 [Verrucomicrobiota bacterium]
MHKFFIVAAACVAGSLTPVFGEVHPHGSPKQELKTFTDPTILRSRVWLETEWNEFNHGESEGKFTFGGVYAWGVSPNQDWALRLKVPIGWHEGGESFDSRDEQGLGDLEVTVGTAFRLNKSWRTGGGIELRGDTASDETLGDGAWRLKPFWSVACDVTHWLTLTLTAEYRDSITMQNGHEREQSCELQAPVTVLLSERWALHGQYKAECDFERDDRWTHAVEAGVSLHLIKVPMLLSASLEKPLDGGDKQFQANLAVTYFFGGKHPQK